jgi:hypothetical protein
MTGVIFPPASVLPECEYVLDLVARQALFFDMYAVTEPVWVQDDEFSPARPVDVDRAAATLILLHHGFLGYGDVVRLRHEAGDEFIADRMIFRPLGRKLHEYINTRR